MISTERLELRSFPRNDAAFAEQLHAICADRDVMRYMERAPHADAWETSTYIGKCEALERYDRGRALAVYERGAPELVGMLTLFQEAPHAIVFGGYLSAVAQRKGYGVEVSRALAQWALSSSRIYRVRAQCDVRNAGAAKVLERAGFTREGVLARAWAGFGGEEPRDVFSYSMTR